VPVVIVSASVCERDRIAALELGADDYLAKPFGVEDLLARVRAALRRTAGGPTDSTLSWSDVPVGNEATCPPATQLAVAPPDELARLIVAVTLAPCNVATIHVSAVRPPS
jgi:DNA-binding response OmpR family regulator